MTWANRVSPGLRRDFVVSFLVVLSIFLAANLIAVHVRSEGGLLEGLGIVDNVDDDIRRIGFPFQFFEEGGVAHRRIINPVALLVDALVMIGCSAGVGCAYVWNRKQMQHQSPKP